MMPGGVGGDGGGGGGLGCGRSPISEPIVTEKQA